VPVTLGDGRVAAIHEWNLSDDEGAGMRAGAQVVRDALGAVDRA